MNDQILLLGDIGGTNARFALTDPETQGYREERVLLCADYETAELAIADYLASVEAPAPSTICLAAAGPILDNGVDLTNNNWHIRESTLHETFGVSHARLLNDFEAVAYSLPELDPTQYTTVGLSHAHDLKQSDFTVAAIGPGTGLGAAGLIRHEGYTVPIISEAGHIGFAPENALQRAVWEILRHRFGRVSDERLVSGAGIENIFTALAEIHKQPSSLLSVADIFNVVSENYLAAETVSLFFEILGQVAGNFALAHCAHDGIYIAGGIVQRYPELLAGSSFRASFENKGRHRHIMERIPTLLIRHPQPGLLGASAVARGLVRAKRVAQV
ncbi:MAG: glucokinase [Flavobacteriaceae bacterium]|jgi:glucokinase